METNKIEKATPRGSQNILLHKISEKYSVGFYTIAAYAIFRYFEKREYGLWEIDRGRMLGRLSEKELKKLFRFEAGKKEKYKKYQVHGIWEK